ncbi:MAG: hypothetical protein IJZ78_03960 [Alistipes sp.]|nr:hypothetical protein [Alistipes sp.]
MKRRLFPLMMLLAGLVAVGCVDPKAKAVEDMDSFIDKVEAESDSYTESDWESADAEFVELSAKLEENYSDMTEEERDEVSKTLGRYYGLQTKRGIESAAKGVKEAFESIPSFIEGFSEAFSDGDAEE